MKRVITDDMGGGGCIEQWPHSSVHIPCNPGPGQLHDLGKQAAAVGVKFIDCLH